MTAMSMDERALKFLDYLKVERNVSRHTMTSYAHDLKEFYDFFGKDAVENVDILSLRRYLAKLKSDNLSKRTVARRMARIRGASTMRTVVIAAVLALSDAALARRLDIWRARQTASVATRPKD